MTIYEINVSGKIYNIKHQILEKIPYFHEFLNSGDKECFVERSSMIFDHVLAYVIDPIHHPYPPKYFYELDFYGIIYEKEIYKVNVLGKIYHIQTAILMKIPYFVKIINGIHNSSIEIYVERSPSLFENVLAYIMDDKYPIDCYSELDYYGIIYKRYNINDKTDLGLAKDSIERQTDKILSKLGDMYDDITKLHTKLDKVKDNSCVEKKLCEYSGCGEYFNVDEDYSGNYCDGHSECRYCMDPADRYNDYLCGYHQ